MKPIHHTVQLIALMFVASCALAQEGPQPAPKDSTKTELKGIEDPYPAADALVRKNTKTAMEAVVGDHKTWEEADLSSTEAWDASGTAWEVAIGANTPSMTALQSKMDQSMRNCTAFDQGIMPQGVSMSSDLHDFVVSPEAMQAELALEGQLFSPMGTQSWKIVSISEYMHFEGNPSNIQLFNRILYFISTASPSQIRNTAIKLSAGRGYQVMDEELRKSPGYVGGDSFTLLNQQVTPMVNNLAIVSADKLGEDEEQMDSQESRDDWLLDCLVTDDFGKNWLDNVNHKTGKEWQPNDLTFGYITQISVIPLGEATEPYTNAHVDERLARERGLKPEQVAALREAEENQVNKEIWRNAPQSQKALAEMAAINEQIADNAEQLQQEGWVAQWAAMVKDISHSLGVNYDTQIDALAKQIDTMLQQVADGARQAAQKIRNFLGSLWN